MKSSFESALQAVAWVALCAAPIPSVSSEGLALSYRAPTGVPAWSEGSVLPLANGAGYLLSVGSETLAHLDPLGNPDWGLWTAEGSMGYTSLTASPPDNAVFAKIEGLATEPYWTVFGLFNAQDGTRHFERGVSVKVENLGGASIAYPTVSAAHLSDGRSAVILDYYSEARFEMAVLDRTGQTEWQRAFAAPSFAISGAGQYPRLIEHPGQGFWLIVEGSQLNLSLNIIRLSSQGEVVWSNQITGLVIDQLLPGSEPSAIGMDGSLALSFIESIPTNSSDPRPSAFAASILVLNPDGQLRWADRVQGVDGTGLTPSWAPGDPAIFLFGGKLRRLSPISVDGLMMKMDGQTGDLLAQQSVGLSFLDALSLAGITTNRVYVHELKWINLSPPAVSYAGYFDLNLQNAHWKQFNTTNGVTAAGLALNRSNSSLSYFSSQTGDSAIDAIQLDLDLNPPAGTTCQFFSDASVTLRDPQMTAEKLTLAQTALNLTVTNAAIVLVPTTRIQLQPFLPVAQGLCPSESLQLGLPTRAAGKLQFSLSRATANVVQIETSSDLLHWAPFARVTNTVGASVLGDAITNAPQRFYRAVLAP
jgi:hypothetical protein